MKGPPDARNRIHSLQLPLHPPSKDGWSDKSEGGQNWTPITPLMGSILHAGTQIGLIAIRLKQTQNKLHMSASFAE
ncbi:hypothetical protein RvVAR031_23110 [Agrobacterium vitis]|nr:hypothetical protein RvVAR031_23110 [Agrobacterium vitis]